MNTARNVRLALLTAMAGMTGGLVTPSSAETVATTPVGAFSQVIPAASVASPRHTFLGFPLVNQPTLAGAVSATSGAQFSLTGTSLQPAQFNEANGQPRFYLEVVSGAGKGLLVDIVSNDASTITTAKEIASVIAVGDRLLIRAHNTIGSLFGTSNQAGLQGGSSVANADEIVVFDPETQTTARYYYKNGGVIGGTGWRSSASVSASQAHLVIYPDEAIAIASKKSTSTTLVTIGEPILSEIKTPVPTGYIYFTNTFPGTSTLSTLNLYTGDSNGLTGGTSISTADEVLRWRLNTATSQWEWERLYYKNGGVIGGTGWRSAASVSTPRDDQQVAYGEGILIRRKSTPLSLRRPKFTIPDPS